jgi:hypothetical protein
MTTSHLPALAALALAACGGGPTRPPVLYPQVQPGPAAQVRPNRVLVLPAACGDVEATCPRSYITAVDAIVRGGLEFVGHNLVESETLLSQTRQRHEEQGRKTTTTDSASSTSYHRPRFDDAGHSQSSSSTTTETTSSIILDGPTFEDLAIGERQAVLQQAGADAVVSVRIIIGGSIGVWAPNQNVEVMVKLGVDHGDVMAWASRCLASSNDFTTVDAALEAAARCAIYGGTGRQ